MKTYKKTQVPNAPRHLRPQTRKWWRSVVESWELQQHHVRELTIAAEFWDEGQRAREVLAADGQVYFDEKLKRPCTRPEWAIFRDCRIGFLRALRELDLDVEGPAEEKRPPALRSIRR